MAIREIRAWTPPRACRVCPITWPAWSTCAARCCRWSIWPRLGWRATEPTPRHAIIVTQLGTQIGGWIVDSVSDIVTVPDEAMQPPPPASGNDTVVPFLDGLAAIEDKMVMVLNLAALADSDLDGRGPDPHTTQRAAEPFPCPSNPSTWPEPRAGAAAGRNRNLRSIRIRRNGR
jgi:purine-binding chemotaxis protein CheW